PDLLHRGHDPDRRHADPAPLLRDEHAEEAERAHLAQQVRGTPPFVPRLRCAARNLLLREVATQAGEVALRLGERQVHYRSRCFMNVDDQSPRSVGTEYGRSRLISAQWRATSSIVGSHASSTQPSVDARKIRAKRPNPAA